MTKQRYSDELFRETANKIVAEKHAQGSITQDRHALELKIEALRYAIREFHNAHGDDALTDEDARLWKELCRHPACQKYMTEGN